LQLTDIERRIVAGGLDVQFAEVQRGARRQHGIIQVSRQGTDLHQAAGVQGREVPSRAFAVIGPDELADVAAEGFEGDPSCCWRQQRSRRETTS
jgi:hypothetical protein